MKTQQVDEAQTFRPVAQPVRERLLSLDVLRGLIIVGMILVTDPGTYSAV